MYRVVIQHHHGDGDLSGVLTYVLEVSDLLRRAGYDVRVLPTHRATLRDRLRAVRGADIVLLNSHDLPLALLARALGRFVLLKYHFPVFRSAHDRFEPLPVLQRLACEARTNFPGEGWRWSWAGWAFFARSMLRVGNMLATSLAASRLCACSAAHARATSFGRRVHVWYNPRPRVEARRDRAPAPAYQPSPTPLLLFAGRLDPEKGADLLLDAAATLAREGRDFEVRVVGDGRWADWLRERSTTLGLDGRVAFLGRRSRTDVLAQMREALAVVVPSRWEEPAGYVAIEAATQGACPVLARVGGLPEMGGDAALYFDREDATGLADALRQCLEDPAAAAARAAAVNRYADAVYSDGDVAARFAQLIC